jgi:hypothetical protein
VRIRYIRPARSRRNIFAFSNKGVPKKSNAFPEARNRSLHKTEPPALVEQSYPLVCILANIPSAIDAATNHVLSTTAAKSEQGSFKTRAVRQLADGFIRRFHLNQNSRSKQFDLTHGSVVEAKHHRIAEHNQSVSASPRSYSSGIVLEPSGFGSPTESGRPGTPLVATTASTQTRRPSRSSRMSGPGLAQDKIEPCRSAKSCTAHVRYISQKREWKSRRISVNLGQEMRIGKSAETVPKAFNKLSGRFLPLVLQIAEVHRWDRRRRTSVRACLQITAQSARRKGYQSS